MKKQIENLFWPFVTKSDGCWIWEGTKNDKKYGQLPRRKGMKRFMAHRISYELHKGIIPEGHYVCHHCDNPPCVNPDHLFVGTAKDNMEDMYKKGRHLIKKVCSRLSMDQIIHIRNIKINQPDIKNVEIAKRFGVSKSSISKIINKQRMVLA